MIWLLPVLLFFSTSLNATDTLRIGSKRFTESYILGEILKQTALATHEAPVELRQGLGNTGIVLAALQEGAIDIYPEYTGTIILEFLKIPNNQKYDLAVMNQRLKPLGLGADILFGFNNSYALAIPEETALKLKINRISDLKKHPQLKFGFSQEFIEREDGWKGLRNTYQLPHNRIMGIDHSLSYEALANNQIDITDVYSTDAKIRKFNLRILEDDLHYFPSYQAVLLYRLEIPKKFPQIWKAFHRLSGSINNEEMRLMNARAELLGESFENIAKGFIPTQEVTYYSSSPKETFIQRLFGSDLKQLIIQHLFLVFGSLIPAILIGIPLGIIAANYHSMNHFILNSVAIIQTIPSLALFAFLIPLLQQIGTLPALIALFLYALLPIVRNTYTGLNDIPMHLRESAIVLGLSPLYRLTRIELPLASRTIFAGVKTAAVINVGMATIAALIGAGGLGERIITGLALNDYEVLLSGAIPACLLAIAVQLVFDSFDRWVIPKGIR